MSQTAITLVFEQWKAQQAATGEPVLLDEFVFALVPGLDPDAPIDRSETLPPGEQIVHRESVSRKGVVNENAVVHSAVLGADVGDFSFNWIGLTNKASGTLAMIVHAPLQQKLKTKEGQQGNVLTRSFLMEFNGAQTETGINTPAETWQIDFTARMAGMDERQRLENIDIYGGAAFFGDGWLVGKTGNQFFVTKGVGYVAGLRAEQTANQNVIVATKPAKVWLDVCWTGALTSTWAVQSQITVADGLTNYELNGIKHYVFALASIDESGVIKDLRPKGSLDSQQGSTDFMRKDMNLADVDSPAEARKNLNLKGAALLDVGAKAGTVAAGDDARIIGAVQRTGDKIIGQLKIQAYDALRIYDEAYGAIFRRSENALHIIPTNKGEGENGGLGSLRPFSLDLATGNITFSKVYTAALSVGNAVFYNDGNINGATWGGWLSNWLNAQFSSRDNNINTRATFNWVSQNFALKNVLSASNNGWFKDISSGLVIQWGYRQSASSGVETTSFNIAFPNTCLAIVATMGTQVSNGNTVYTALVNNQGFNYKTSGGAMGFTFLALGY